MQRILLILALFLTFSLGSQAQIGQKSRKQEKTDSLNRENSKGKEVPKGIKMWSVDRRFGDRHPLEADTLMYMYPNRTFTNGERGEYNSLGQIGSPRINRIATDRPSDDGDFLFTQPLSYFMKTPEQWQFTNTLSPWANLSYQKGGSRTNGEDHFTARFAVNAGKRLGFGFKVDYLYGTGYMQDQNSSLLNFSLYGSYLGDKYDAHLLLGYNAIKMTENGGLTNDYYITHPETFKDSYAQSEMPTVLTQNWNRNKNFQTFLTHRYNIGFHRKVRMTDEEIEAKKFAWDAKKDKIKRDSTEQEVTALTDSDFYKQEFVPVTSFIHTMELGTYERIYQAYPVTDVSYATYDKIFAHDYYSNLMSTDSILDKTKHFRLRNTLAVSLLEGFNRWMVAGIKLFAASDLRTYTLPDENNELVRYTDHGLNVGGQLASTSHKLLHYKAQAEFCLTGDNIGQVKIDGAVDFNFRLFGDTVTLAANGFFHNGRANYYLRHYHSRHFRWDDNLGMQTQTHIEGLFSYRKTRTSLRVAADMYTRYTYMSDTYDLDSVGNRLKNWDASVQQSSSPVSVLTAELSQKFTFLRLINWETVLTFQQSTNQDILPVPALNVYTNLFLKFKIAHVLNTEFGADARYFTRYYSPDYLPALGQYVVQGNEEKVKVGNYPIINVYANFKLKGARFFVMYTHAGRGMGNKSMFLTPHYPVAGSLLRLGINWTFWN